MDPHGLVLALFLGAAVIALWVEIRFAERGPTSLSRILVHVIVAVLVLRVAMVAVQVMVGPDAAQTMIALFAVVLPALVYVFVTTLWVMRMVRGAMLR